MRAGGAGGAWPLFGGCRDSSSGDRSVGGNGSTGFVLKPATPPCAIGAIERLIGSAAVVRPSGIAQLKVGDPVFRDDVVETTADGQVCIHFIDNTVVSLSNSARMALKEFPANGNSHAALFDITRGDFSFTVGELAKAGHLEIATPFANIRGRSRVGGIGTLSLISLFFAAMEKVQAAGPAIGYLDDGVIIANYKDDEPHGSFELVTKEATPRRIFVDDPGVTWALRLNSSSELSVSQVSNSPAQMIQLQAIQQNVLRTYAVGLQAMQGPTVSGPNGSPTPIFDLPGSNLQRINFGPSDNSPAIENLNSSPQSSPNSSSLKTTSATTSTSGSSQNTVSSIEESVFIPPPPPPPANVLTPPVITTTAPALDNASSINIAGTALANSTVALANNGSAIGTTTADASGHWSINGIALSNGANYSFTATATDVSNNSSPPSNQLAFHVDQTPPAAPVITTTASAQINASSINVAGTAEANSTVTLSNNGNSVGTTTADGSGHWSVNGIPLSNGADNNFTATATDAANNLSGPSNTLIFHDDQTVPTESFPTVTLTSDTGTSNSDFITSNGGVHFAGAVADTGGAGIGSVQVFNGATLLGTATVVAGNWSLDTTLAAGTYNNLKVTVTDLAGNASTTTTAQTIIVDFNGADRVVPDGDADQRYRDVELRLHHQQWWRAFCWRGRRHWRCRHRQRAGL